MDPDIRAIAESFDARAARYARSDWHRRSAERLVALCPLRPGNRVLDGGTGTGFATLAVACRVGREGYVCGVDVSRGMLREARAAVARAGVTHVELLEADASCLPQYEAASFDAVVCATALLYIPIAPALREWHRLLKSGGVVAFSTMQTGSPPAARLFRECAAAFGVMLKDPWEPLGSAAASRQALEEAGFEVADSIDETIEFSADDLAVAWESNVRSLAHREIQRLTDDEQRALRDQYLAALACAESENPRGLRRAHMLYAIGRR